MNLIPNQTKVKFKDGDAVGKTSAITIRGKNDIQYEVVIWNNNDRKSIWVNANEIQPAEERQPLKIGFVR